MMTTHERFTRMYEHREADRIPIFDKSLVGNHRPLVRRGHAHPGLRFLF